MSTWNIDLQLLWKSEPWANKEVKMYYKRDNWTDFGGSHSVVSYTDDDGHASFEIGDEDSDDDGISEDTPSIFTISNHGNYDFGPYTVGGGGYTIDMDPETEREQLSFD